MLRPLMCSLAVVALAPATAAAETKTFDRVNGNWSVAANWTPAGVPVAGDDVVIKGGYMATLTGTTPQLGSVTINGIALVQPNARLASSGATIQSGGRLRGGGTIAGPVSNPSGYVEEISLLTVEGDYVQGPQGRLVARVSGATPGTGHSRLAVTGAATLAGHLLVSTPLATTPAPGDYDILTAATATGAFSLSTGLEGYALSYPGTGVRLTVTGAPPADPQPDPVPGAGAPVTPETPQAPPAPTPAAPEPVEAPDAATTVRPEALGLLKARPCARPGRFRIRLRAPKGHRLRSAVVSVNGKAMKPLKGKRLKAPVVLRRLPKATFTVRVVAVTTKGARLQASRAYRTCASRR